MDDPIGDPYGARSDGSGLARPGARKVSWTDEPQVQLTLCPGNLEPPPVKVLTVPYGSPLKNPLPGHDSQDLVNGSVKVDDYDGGAVRTDRGWLGPGPVRLVGQMSFKSN